MRHRALLDPMKCALSLLFLTALGLSGAIPPAPCAQSSSQPVAVGELVPDFEFKEFLTAGDGRRKLSEFRGQPVLIVNWTDTDFGRGAADKARKLAEKFVPLGLVLVLRDTHNRSADEILSARMRLYPESPGRFMRNMELPIAYEDNGPPPDVALIDLEGRLVVAGSYTVDLRKAEKLVKDELKKHKSGWGEHASVQKARALAFGKNQLANAMACCEEALAAEPEQAELLALQDEVLLRFTTLQNAASYHMERGECVLALREATELRAAVSGRGDWEALADQTLAHFDTPEARRELELDAKFSKLLEPLAKDEPDERDVKKLERFADEAGDTRVGRRAREVARIAALATRSE